MKMNLYKVMPLCMLLSLGACSSDEEIFEDNNGVEVPSQGEFKTMRFGLGSNPGGMEFDNSKQSRLLGDWEAGWAPVNEAQAEFSPSQVYPLKKVYALIKPGESLNDWTDARDSEVKVLEFDVKEGRNAEGHIIYYIDLLYNAKNNIVTLSDGHNAYTSNAEGFNMLFSSQKEHIYTLPVHPNLKTPNGTKVYAPAGDNLFRSLEFNLKAVGDKFEFVDVNAGTGADPLETNPLLMHRGTCSFNSKLIFTDYGFPLDASEGHDDGFQDNGNGHGNGNHHCNFEKIIWQIIMHKHDDWFEKDNWDDLDIFDFDFDDDDKFDCDIDWFDFCDDEKEAETGLYVANLRKSDANFKDADTKGNCTIKNFLTKTGSITTTEEAKKSFLDDIFKGCPTKTNKAGKTGRCISWKKFWEIINKHKQDKEEDLADKEAKLLEDLSMWTISTFIAPNRTHENAMPYPHTFDFFLTDMPFLAFGKAVFNEPAGEGNGIVALTKEARALVGNVSYIGKPINFPTTTEYLGVGKDFNFGVSPFVLPFYIDGRYDLCFAIKQQLADGNIKSATLRFPIENKEYDENGQESSRGTNFMNAGNSIFKTVIIDVDDFAAKWNAKVTPRAVRGVFDNVVDLEENVLDVKYEML